MSGRALRAMLVVAIAAASMTVVARSAPAVAEGSAWLDATYGSGGVATLPIASVPAQLTTFQLGGTAVRPDGTTVVVGAFLPTSLPTACGNWVVARLLPDGSPDPTFGTAGSGSRTLPESACIGTSLSFPTAVAVQSTGHIVLGGGPLGRYLRLNPDGSTDAAFGTKSFISNLTTNCSVVASITSITVADNDDIVVAGSAPTIVAGPVASGPRCVVGPISVNQFLVPRVRIERRTPAGTAVSLPTSAAAAPWPATTASADGAWPLTGGTIVVKAGSSLHWWSSTGSTTTTAAGRVVATDGVDRVVSVGSGSVRVARAGVDDATFGVAGVAAIPAFDVRSVGLAPDGGVVVAGLPGPPNADSWRLLATRLLPSGDSAFGGNGVLDVPVRNGLFLERITPRVGPVAVDGSTRIELGPGRSVVIGPDGTAGPFDGAGFAFPQVACGQRGATCRSTPRRSIAADVLPDGSVLRIDADGLRRLGADGLTIDPTFGVGGVLVPPLGGGATPHRLPDGRLIVAAASPSGIGVYLLRYTADGQPDPTWGGGAPVVLDALSGIERMTAPDAAGRVVVTGADSSGAPVVYRLDATGSVDPTFRFRGKPAGGDPRYYSWVTVPTGYLVIGVSDAGELAVLRLDTDGADPVVVDSGNTPSSLLPDPSGRVLSVGAGVRRLLPDGTLDTVYGVGGVAVLPPEVVGMSTPFGGVGSDGSVVLAVGTTTRAALLRLTPSGTPDADWANGGLLRLARVAAEPTQLADGRTMVILDGADLARVVAAPAVDDAGPVITLSAPMDGAVYASSSVPPVSFDCADAQSLVASCVAAVANGGSLSSVPGTYTFTVDAVDGAGNVSSRTAAYTVRFGYSSPSVGPGSNLQFGDVTTPESPFAWALSNITSTGPLSITSGAEAAPTPGAAATIGTDLQVVVPPGAAADPMLLSVAVNAASTSGIGASPATLQPYLDGVAVPTCAVPAAADPDPCVVAGGVNANGDVAFVFRLTHGGTFTFGLPANAAPVAVFDVATTRPGIDVTVVVTANDTDADGDGLTATLASAPAAGVATCAGTACTYRSNVGYTGADSFTYELADGRGGAAVGTVTVTVSPDLGASANLIAGGSITTDPGTGATPADPVQAGLTLPPGTAGVVSLAARATQTLPPAGFGLLGTEVVITAPAAPGAADPLRLELTVDSGLLPVGVTAQTLSLFRNGVEVPPCVGPGADPSPCIPAGGRVDLPGGDARLSVLTVAASTWSVGVRGPTAVAGGPYTVDEGSAVLLDGRGSASAAGASLVYAWTIGGIASILGSQPSYTGVDDGVVPVSLTVSDGLTAATATSSIRVRNVAPTVAPVVATATIGSASRVTATIVDPGVPDTHTVSVDWGDGTSGSASVTGRSVTATHAYPRVGSFTVRVTVRDDDGGSSSASVAARVVYPFALVGLQTPPATNTWVAAVPVVVPFSLGGNRSTTVLAATPSTIRVDCGTGAPIGAAATMSGALVYESRTARYVWTGVTARSWAGTCRDLRLPLNDGTTAIVRYTFR